MKLAIIGLGLRMKGMVNAMLEAHPDLKIVGVYDQNPEVKANLPEAFRDTTPIYSSVDELICKSMPDAVAIGTRCNTHADLAIQVAKYNLPLFLEKPVAISMAQAVALEKAYEHSGDKVVVSFPLRVSTLCARAKQLLDQGVTGRIDHLMAVNYVSYGNVYFDQWYRDYSVTQGLFLQKATHDFDYLAYLAGAPITKVAAMASCGRVYRDVKTLHGTPDPNAIYLPEVGTPEEGMNEDSSSALIEFANGAKGVYTQVFFSKGLPRRGVTVSGYKGALDFDWYRGDVLVNHHRAPYKDRHEISGSEGHFGGDAHLVRSFIDLVTKGTPSPTPLSTGLESVYACLAAKESAETGTFVSVRQVGSCG